MIHGVIQHDVYHAGQIGLIKKALKGMQLEEEDDFGAFDDRANFGGSDDYY